MATPPDGDARLRRLASVVLWTVVSMVLSAALRHVSEGLGDDEPRSTGWLVDPRSIDVRLRDVGGLRRAKEELYFTLLLPLRDGGRFFRTRGPMATSRGVLLSGPPGCGKTLLMKAIARHCGCAFLHPTLATLQSKYFGESQKIARRLFADARRHAPSIIFVDEIDSVFGTRRDDDAGAELSLKNEFLVLMDGIGGRADEAVVFVGATNRPHALDPAFRRRLPVHIAIELPTADERRHIAKLLCTDEPDARASYASFEALRDEQTTGMSGAQLAEAYRAACRRRLRETLAACAGDVTRLDDGRALAPLTRAHWADAIGETRPIAAVADASTDTAKVASRLRQLAGRFAPSRV